MNDLIRYCIRNPKKKHVCFYFGRACKLLRLCPGIMVFWRTGFFCVRKNSERKHFGAHAARTVIWFFGKYEGR